MRTISKERYDQLYGLIRWYKHQYYVRNESAVGDQQYDELEKEFDEVATKLGLPGSWIGYDPTK